MVPLTSWVGRPVVSGDGGWHGSVRDVAVDLSRPPGVVAGLLVGNLSGRRFAPWKTVSAKPSGGAGFSIADDPTLTGLPDSHVLLVRDLLDSRVYDVARRRATRVAEVWLDERGDEVVVAGVEVGARAAMLRLCPRSRPATTAGPARLLTLADLHITTPHGHRAQLATETAAVHQLEGLDLAHLLTHLAPSQAADVARRLPDGRVRPAVTRLHPHVRRRLQRALDREHAALRKPRTRRTAGWRLYLPRDHDGAER